MPVCIHICAAAVFNRQISIKQVLGVHIFETIVDIKSFFRMEWDWIDSKWKICSA